MGMSDAIFLYMYFDPIVRYFSLDNILVNVYKRYISPHSI